MRFLIVSAVLIGLALPAAAALLEGEITDSETGELVSARLYIESEDGNWFHA
ncbi:MAG: hypothetical protein ACI8UO_004192 [Verrucomicrobiales bacterium]|jgi:hypothetical protein